MEIINFSECIYLSYPIQHNLNSYFVKYVEECSKNIDKLFKSKTIVIACKGHSGSMIASSVAFQLKTIYNKQVVVCILRKFEEKAHNNQFVSYLNILIKNPIVVIDDFIETGHTIRSIISAIHLLIGEDRKIDELIVTNSELELSKYHKDIIENFQYILCNQFLRFQLFVKGTGIIIFFQIKNKKEKINDEKNNVQIV